jgi:predicted ATPase
MRLRELRIETFKSYEDEAIPLEPVSFLVGPNGGGKTGVLQAIEFFGALTRGTLREELEMREFEYKDLPWLRGERQQFGFTAFLEWGEDTLEWLLRFGARRNPGIHAERVALNDEELMHRRERSMGRLDRTSGTYEEVRQTLTSSWLAAIEDPTARGPGRKARIEDEERFPELVSVADWARGIRRYVTLDPAVLRRPSRRTSTGIGPRGEDLAGFLRWLRDQRSSQFEAMLARVRERYKPLRGLELKTAGFGWFRISVEEHWGKGTVRLLAPQVSDGLLRLIAISALHELPDPPSVVMIDEIENGLHPHLVGHVVEMLEELSEKTRIQVVATSHSPIALNYVSDASHVVIVGRDAQGRSRARRLDTTPGFGRIGDQLDPGELWYNLGEEELFRTRRRRRR